MKSPLFSEVVPICHGPKLLLAALRNFYRRSLLLQQRGRGALGAGSLAVILLFLTLGGIGACSKAPQSIDDGSPKKIDDNTVQLSQASMANLLTAGAQVRDFPDLLELMGRISVVENRVTVVPARVAGRIDAIDAVSGEFVSKGQALALEFSPDYLEAREEYRQALHDDTATAESGMSPSAQGTFVRSDFLNLAAMTRKKLSNMGLSSQDIDALSSTGPGEDNHLIIRAPSDGAILSLSSTVGNLQNVGDTLFTIADLSKVWFAGDLYAEDLSKVHTGQIISISATGLDKTISGKISFISPMVDPSARTIKVRALIDNPDLVLRQDMYVRGQVILSQRMALLIPSQAILRLNNSDCCFRQVAPFRFQRVTLKLGRSSGGFSEVKAGLEAGDVVISQGALLLDAVLENQGE